MSHDIEKLSFLGRIEKGQLFLNNRKYFDFMLHKSKDCKIRMNLERLGSRKTNNQLGLLWGAWYPTIGEVLGYSDNELHYDIFMPLFAPEKIVKYRGRERTSKKRMSDFTVTEMVEYMLQVEREAGELGITLPRPEDYDYAPLK